MRKKFLSAVAALGAVALVSGMLAVTANAHIGASHSPIHTDLPDLTSVEVVDGGSVDYCFDEVVTDFSSEADFLLSGYNADTVAAGDDAEPDPDQEKCILVDFDDDRDAENFTIGYILDGAAETRAGDEAIANAAALTGSTAEGGDGVTVAPNLTEWDTASSDEIDYTFDEQIDCDRAEAGDPNTYGFYDDNGELEEGDDITDCDDDDATVRVEFNTGEDVDDATLAWYDENHGDDELCEPVPVSVDPGGCTSIEADGGDTDFADLTDVERTDDDEWTFSYDDNLDDGTCDFLLFHVYQEDGTEFTGTACNEDDDVVEVTFGALNEDARDEEFPLAAAENAAVDDEDGDPSTIGDGAPSESEEASGYTDAPDLETVREADDDLVDFYFDETVDDDFAFDEDKFYLIDQDGDTVSGDDVDDAGDNVVTIQFDPDDVADAIGGGVEDDAAADFNVDLSEPAAAAFGSPTPTTTTTSTTSPSASTPPPPSVIKAGSTLSIHYDRTPARRAAFKGGVKSRFHKCEKGRQVELHKKGTGVVGRDSSNRRGKWKVRYPRAQGQFFAEVLRKVYTRADGVTVVCKKDSTLD
jgi:hypothetical protein